MVGKKWTATCWSTSGKRHYSQNRRIRQLRIMEDERGIWNFWKNYGIKWGTKIWGFYKAEFTRPSRSTWKIPRQHHSTITNGIKAKRGGDNAEGALNNGRQIAKNADQEEPNLHTTLAQNQQRNNGDLFSDLGLHTTLTQEQQLNNGDQERCSFLEPANRIMETISTHPGDYSQRAVSYTHLTLPTKRIV